MDETESGGPAAAKMPGGNGPVGRHLHVDGHSHLDDAGYTWARSFEKYDSGFFCHHVPGEQEEAKDVPASWRAIYAEARRRKLPWVIVDMDGGAEVPGLPVY
jgi:hypothetical protein